MERWASFDCYGTLIDWDGGVRAELARVFGDERADDLLVAVPRRSSPSSRHRASSVTARCSTESMRRLGAPGG